MRLIISFLNMVSNMQYNVLFPSGRVISFAIKDAAIMYAKAYGGFLMESLDIFTEQSIMVSVE